MSDPTKLVPDQRAELAAYLDGELDEAATQAMERVLAESPEARHEVDMLARTFSLLDVLPRPNASTGFSAKTLSSLKAERIAPRWSDRGWYRQARRGAILACWVVGLSLAGATGYFAANRMGHDEDARLIRELPVIENLDAYSEVTSIEDVREMAKHGDFDEEKDGDDDQP